ncbi:MAG: hypothetical protein GTO51_04280 [Candidatus Latescibacteria bacterium]|nr:hypothetical protein [Candidatus Latescibacterota bacterium]NIM21058.1 hypothetical protein [Candidatus Latescibacterota bacterium]NIM65193.1 hypothetical protein [Candidatus Latescibacterota bacterium]NIO01708.1 hypothetical protein [Candidatus Latescibacterota bacterium]NIO28225.1 hypothetical protein [Candidatus Latescibacterota bacterium]
MTEIAFQKTRGPFLYSLTARLLSYTPHWLLFHVSRVGGLVHFLVSREKRRSYLSNLASAAHIPRGFKALRAFQNHALNVLEILKATSESPSEIMERVTIQGKEHLDDALRTRTGLILVTIHSGNWELSGLALALHGYPITTIAGEQLRDDWSECVKDWKRKYGIHVLSPGRSLRDLYRDLQNGRFVVLHMDGNLFSGGTELTFLGKRIRLPRGPAHLAHVAGVPITIAVCRRKGMNHLEISVRGTLPPPRSADAEFGTTHKLAANVENCILEDPGQWCIFRRM